MAQSSVEAKYISTTTAANQAIWLRKILSNVGQYQDEAIVIWIDNKSTITIMKNPAQHGRNKHINVKSHAIKKVKK